MSKWDVCGIVIILLLILLSCLPNNTEIKFILELVTFSIILILYVYVTYKDIVSKQYTTTILIVLTDILMIFAVVSCIFMILKSYHVVDNEIVVYSYKIGAVIIIFSFAIILLRRLFTREKYTKKIS